MAELKNEFSWSKSRDETFHNCLRQYYFHYYGSWGGWKFDAPERTRAIYVLKQLKSRQTWAGVIVHACIERTLQNIQRGIEPMALEQIIETTLAVMRKDYVNSKNRHYWDNPKSCGLFEHEYELPIEDSAWKDIARHVENCLKNFYQSEIFKKIQKLPKEQWLEMEDFSGFEMDGVKVHVVIDFSFQEDQDVYIYDWKTSRSDHENNEIQFACYSFYAMTKWLVKPEQVHVVEFNLASNRQAVYNYKAADLVSIQEYIRGSMRDMRLLLADPDTNMAMEERFSLVENERVCQYCNFKKVCPKWKK